MRSLAFSLILIFSLAPIAAAARKSSLPDAASSAKGKSKKHAPAPADPGPDAPDPAAADTVVDSRFGQLRITNGNAPRAGRGPYAPASDAAPDPASPDEALTAGTPAGSASGVSFNRPVPAIPAADSLHPEQAQTHAWIRQAQTMLDLNDYEAAIENTQKVIALAPDHPKAYTLKASALNLSGRYKEAEIAALRAITIMAENRPAYENLAWSQLRQRNYTEAQRSASRALQIDSNSALAYAIRAYARQMTADRAGARADMLQAASLDPQFRARADLAERGASIYDPDASDASYLIRAAAAIAHTNAPAWPIGAGALAVLALAGIGLWRLRARPRRSASLINLAGGALPADLLAGKYRLGPMIGRGGMGAVYSATDASLGRPVAIKQLSPEILESVALGREYFLREARTVASLHHPAIVDIYEIVEDGPDLYLVFEFVSGKTVSHLLAENSRLSLDLALEILRPVCQALHFAHSRNLVHRDIKPANIMVTEQGHVKLMDFGIARSLSERGAAGAQAGGKPALFDRTQTIAGTPSYMAPEIEAGVISRSGDIYALGACLYEMLTGSHPFGSDALPDKALGRFLPATTLLSTLPPALDALCSAALDPDPARRIQSPLEFLQRLESLRGSAKA
ncbi:MAG: protein kinase [Elusimicrobiota bacterium]|jgi:tetratricopeptide (TPR) repeat protein